MTRLESKIKPTPVVRQFKKEYDFINVTIDTVELTDGDITKLSNCRIANTVNDSWTGDFYMSGETGIDGDHRVLHINIPFAGYTELLPKIIEVLTELENNDFDEVKEFASEVRFRLASEARFRLASEARKQAEAEAAKAEAENESESTEETVTDVVETAVDNESEPTEENTTEDTVTEETETAADNAQTFGGFGSAGNAN